MNPYWFGRGSQMRHRFAFWKVGLVIAVVLAIVPAWLAGTASNTVPTTRAALITRPIRVNDLKPGQCAALTLTKLLIAAPTGTTNGSASSELILGGPGNQTINGKEGDDCIVGGGGADQVDGGSGTNVCIISQRSSFTGCQTVVRR